MIGGSLVIDVEASYEKLEKDLIEIASKAAQSGDLAGKEFGSEFQKATKTGLMKIEEEITSSLKRAVGSKSIAQAFAASLKTAATGGDIADVLQNISESFNRVPILGSFVQAGGAVADLIYGSSKAAGEAAKQMEKVERAAAAAAYYEDKMNAQRQALRDGALDHETALLRLQMSNMEELEDKRGVVRKRLEIELFEAQRQRDQSESVLTDPKLLSAVGVRYEDQVAEAKERARRGENAIVRAEAEKAKAEAETKAKKDGERVKELLDEVAALEKTRVEMSQATDSASTAFGTFKFSAYTEIEKRDNDKYLLSEVRRISAVAAKIAANAGGII